MPKVLWCLQIMPGNLFPLRKRVWGILGLLLMAVASVHASVTLVSFTASPGHQQVELRWETATEINNAGFFISRGLTHTGVYTRVSPFIPAEGDDLTGAEYSYLDQDLVNGMLYYYMLEAISNDQSVESHGPISVTVGEPSPTPVAVTPTPSRTPTPGATPTWLPPTPAPLDTATPTVPRTATPVSSATFTPVPTASATRTATWTPWPRSTATFTPSPGATFTPGAAASATRTATWTPWPQSTATFTLTPGATFTPGAAASATRTATSPGPSPTLLPLLSSATPVATLPPPRFTASATRRASSTPTATLRPHLPTGTPTASGAGPGYLLPIGLCGGGLAGVSLVVIFIGLYFVVRRR